MQGVRHTPRFLSCLFGSERAPLVRVAVVEFLSCLFGSEQIEARLHRAGCFLSCLFGSERACLTALALLTFLSCLFGSEPDKGCGCGFC